MCAIALSLSPLPCPLQHWKLPSEPAGLTRAAGWVVGLWGLSWGTSPALSHVQPGGWATSSLKNCLQPCPLAIHEESTTVA